MPVHDILRVLATTEGHTEHERARAQRGKRSPEHGGPDDTYNRRWGRLKDGVKHGPWTTVEEGRITEVIYWRDGVRHGPSRSWYTDGIYQDRMLDNGQFHGRYRIFYEPGQIAEIGWYDRNIRKGYWCSWEPDGSMEYIRFYRRDRVRKEDKRPVGDCPLTSAEPRHLDINDQDYR